MHGDSGAIFARDKVTNAMLAIDLYNGSVEGIVKALAWEKRHERIPKVTSRLSGTPRLLALSF
ncbi:unnamed protein product [Hymenolepis diminuta]|uniref:Uncharacterized protein n=1 Tax=Hymenolepis diminuta TaxID=6216 RepID=A0A564YUR7_HYMDI|nr:unnamed protein product [Hymenolepis diminuta]